MLKVDGIVSPLICIVVYSVILFYVACIYVIFFPFMWQSVEQIGNRADRLCLGIGSDIYLYSSNDIEVLTFSSIITFLHLFDDL